MKNTLLRSIAALAIVGAFCRFASCEDSKTVLPAPAPTAPPSAVAEVRQKAEDLMKSVDGGRSAEAQAKFLGSCVAAKQWGDLDDPKVFVKGDMIHTVPESLTLTETLCDHNFDRCDPAKWGARGREGICTDMMNLQYIYSAVQGHPDRHLCELGLADLKIGADKIDRACGLLVDAALNGTSDFCKEFEPGEKCKEAMVLAYGKIDRAKLHWAENCLVRSAINAKEAKGDFKNCSENYPCRALLGDPAVCGKDAREAKRANAAKQPCAHEWHAADLAQVEKAAGQLHDLSTSLDSADKADSNLHPEAFAAVRKGLDADEKRLIELKAEIMAEIAKRPEIPVLADAKK